MMLLLNINSNQMKYFGKYLSDACFCMSISTLTVLNPKLLMITKR